jgi:hypothetical protein
MMRVPQGGYGESKGYASSDKEERRRIFEGLRKGSLLEQGRYSKL